MRNIQTVSLERVIVHTINSDTATLTLSARQIPFTPDGDIAKYFQAHILASLHDTRARTANFLDDSALRPICDSLLKSPSRIVSDSKTMVQQLHLASDRRISSGAIAICTFATPQLSSVPRIIAILKLDPSDGFQPIKTTDAKGRVIVELNKVTGVVPVAGQRLQKCAFIRPQPTLDASNYRIIVLDGQSSEPGKPARFFLKKFLGAEHHANVADMTLQFYRNAILAEAHLRQHDSVDAADRLHRAARVALDGPQIQPDSLADSLGLSDEHKSCVADALAKDIPDLSFAVDPSVAEAITKKRVFKTQGFMMSIDAELYPSYVESMMDDGGITTLRLRIPGLKEVAK
ncbi:MAG: nucleoid-associated protein [Planctomycetota bacterium]